MSDKAPIDLILEGDLRGAEAVDRRDGFLFKITDDLVNAGGVALLGLEPSDRALAETLIQQARLAGRTVSTSAHLLSRGIKNHTGRWVAIIGQVSLFQRLKTFERYGLIAGLEFY